MIVLADMRLYQFTIKISMNETKCLDKKRGSEDEVNEFRRDADPL